MAESVVYSSVFGAVLSSLRSVRTRLVVFDTEVVDLTEDMDDPVDVLFGVQLGGGTDINRALAYCQASDHPAGRDDPGSISHLYEGGIAEEMLRRAAALADGSHRSPFWPSATAAIRPSTRTTPPRSPASASRPSPAPGPVSRADGRGDRTPGRQRMGRHELHRDDLMGSSRVGPRLVHLSKRSRPMRPSFSTVCQLMTATSRVSRMAATDTSGGKSAVDPPLSQRMTT